MISARGLTCRYGDRTVVDDLSFDLPAGRLTAILGPNGAGKSTLLRALVGLGTRETMEGEVLLDGVPLRSIPRKTLARTLAFVSQDPPSDVPFTVAELVLMGRAPYLGRLAFEGPQDRAIADEAMRAADILAMAHRPIDQLSGGERRRAFYARALAQQPRWLLLDEPTAFLDLGHQAQLLEQAHALSRRGVGVVAVLHDPNLASTFADEILLLKEGRLVAQGTPIQVLDADRLGALYGTRLVRLTGPDGKQPVFTYRNELASRPPSQ